VGEPCRQRHGILVARAQHAIPILGNQLRNPCRGSVADTLEGGLLRLTDAWGWGYVDPARTIRLILAALGIAILCILPVQAEAQQVRGLSADLTFHFTCSGESTPKFDEALERFLRQRGFEVLNRHRLLRERNRETDPWNFGIDAVDEEGRIIFISASGGMTPGVYGVQLFSRPPTHRSKDLEEEVMTFVSGTLKCRTREIVRKESKPEMLDFYTQFFETVKTRISTASGEL
jgi:hypothetical protein